MLTVILSVVLLCSSNVELRQICNIDTTKRVVSSHLWLDFMEIEVATDTKKHSRKAVVVDEDLEFWIQRSLIIPV